MPRAQQFLAILSQMSNDIADFMRRKPCINRDRQVVKPKLSFMIASTDVDVCGLVARV
jgi:hypothetical protein